MTPVFGSGFGTDRIPWYVKKTSPTTSTLAILRAMGRLRGSRAGLRSIQGSPKSTAKKTRGRTTIPTTLRLGGKYLRNW